MELVEHSCRVIKSARLEDNTCKSILNSLKFEHSSLRRTIQNRICVVESRADQSMPYKCSSRKIKCVSDMT